jgi:hypothetical protein
MMKDERAVLMLEVLVKPYAWHRLRDHPELDQVEGPHEHVGIIAPITDTIKVGDGVGPARDGLPVDNAGP